MYEQICLPLLYEQKDTQKLKPLAYHFPRKHHKALPHIYEIKPAVGTYPSQSSKEINLSHIHE